MLQFWILLEKNFGFGPSKLKSREKKVWNNFFHVIELQEIFGFGASNLKFEEKENVFEQLFFMIEFLGL